jgi:hypothetical protein
VRLGFLVVSPLLIASKFLHWERGRSSKQVRRSHKPARERVRLALHVDSFDADSVVAHCMPWLLDPFSFLQGCSCSRRDAVCSVIAAFVLLVGASVADDLVSAGSCVFASGLVRRALSALVLPPVSRVARRCPLPFRPARGAEAEAPLG